MNGALREKLVASCAVVMAVLASVLGWKVEDAARRLDGQAAVVEVGQRSTEMDALRRRLAERPTLPEAERYLELLEQADRWAETPTMCAWARPHIADPEAVYRLMEACLRAARASSVDDLTWASPADREFYARRAAELERARVERSP
jgi:hypothetical protein